MGRVQRHGEDQSESDRLDRHEAYGEEPGEDDAQQQRCGGDDAFGVLQALCDGGVVAGAGEPPFPDAGQQEHLIVDGHARSPPDRALAVAGRAGQDDRRSDLPPVASRCIRTAPLDIIMA